MIYPTKIVSLSTAPDLNNSSASVLQPLMKRRWNIQHKVFAQEILGLKICWIVNRLRVTEKQLVWIFCGTNRWPRVYCYYWEPRRKWVWPKGEVSYRRQLKFRIKRESRAVEGGTGWYILPSFHLTPKGKEIRNEKIWLFFGNDPSLVGLWRECWWSDSKWKHRRLGPGDLINTASTLGLMHWAFPLSVLCKAVPQARWECEGDRRMWGRRHWRNAPKRWILALGTGRSSCEGWRSGQESESQAEMEEWGIIPGGRKYWVQRHGDGKRALYLQGGIVWLDSWWCQITKVSKYLEDIWWLN